MQDQEQASMQRTHACYDSQSEITNQAHSTTYSMYRQPEDSDWVWNFRSRRLIENIG